MTLTQFPYRSEVRISVHYVGESVGAMLGATVARALQEFDALLYGYCHSTHGLSSWLATLRLPEWTQPAVMDFDVRSFQAAP